MVDGESESCTCILYVLADKPLTVYNCVLPVIADVGILPLTIGPSVTIQGGVPPSICISTAPNELFVQSPVIKTDANVI
jgi:hypothetical protein